MFERFVYVAGDLAIGVLAALIVLNIALMLARLLAPKTAEKLAGQLQPIASVFRIGRDFRKNDASRHRA
ncbi:MAG: hypothetical protein ACHQF3_12105 [Alphaproteobacteria bacterium]